MRHVTSLVVAAAVALVVAACVSDSTPAQGTLDGACFSNGTCNTGLRCQGVGPTATCVPADAAAATDASIADASGQDAPGQDTGLPMCTFAATPWPTACPGGQIGAACFGAAQDCSATACGDPKAMAWQCFGPNQCSGAPCCVPASNGALTPQKNCLQGALTMTSGTLFGSICGSGSACAASDAGPAVQLCQFNYQCPTGQICSPVKVASSEVTLNGDTLGACMSP